MEKKRRGFGGCGLMIGRHNNRCKGVRLRSRRWGLTHTLGRRVNHREGEALCGATAGKATGVRVPLHLLPWKRL